MADPFTDPTAATTTPSLHCSFVLRVSNHHHYSSRQPLPFTTHTQTRTYDPTSASWPTQCHFCGQTTLVSSKKSSRTLSPFDALSQLYRGATGRHWLVLFLLSLPPSLQPSGFTLNQSSKNDPVFLSARAQP